MSVPRPAFRRRESTDQFVVITSLSQVPPPVFGRGVRPAAQHDPLGGIRKDIRVALRGFNEPLVLKEPSKDLADAVSFAVSDVTGVDLPKRMVRRLSVSGMLAQIGGAASAAGWPPAAVERFAVSVRQRVFITLGSMLTARFASPLSAALGDRAFRELALMVRDGLNARLLAVESDPVDALEDVVLKSLGDCLFYQFGFIAAGMEKEAALLIPFTEMFCRGNVPVGTLDDGSFLVLLA